MHPVLLGQVAQDHVHSLIEEADAAHLARISGPHGAGPFRHRLGLRLIAAGNKLACEQRSGVATMPGGHA